MNWRDWSKDNAGYSRKLLDAGLEGARSGGEAFLNGRPLAPFLNESARNAVKPILIGACLGAVGSYAMDRQKTVGRTLAGSLLGGAIGFGVGVAWQLRGLAISVGSNAWKSVGRVRDEHWLEENPIDYA